MTIRKRVAAAIVAGVLTFGLPLSVNAQNNQGQNNQGQNNNDQGQNGGSNSKPAVSAPLPEPATWIGMGTLAGAAALLVLAQRRRKTA